MNTHGGERSRKREPQQMQQSTQEFSTGAACTPNPPLPSSPGICYLNLCVLASSSASGVERITETELDQLACIKHFEQGKVYGKRSIHAIFSPASEMGIQKHGQWGGKGRHLLPSCAKTPRVQGCRRAP